MYDTMLSGSLDLAPLVPEETNESPALEAWAEFLNRRWKNASAQRILSEAIHIFFPNRLAVVSSFGADAAVLLQLVANESKDVPVLFLDTGKHFMETLTYRDILVGRFGFTDARSLEPSPEDLKRQDPTGELWKSNPDRCCNIRKVIPLSQALSGFSAWITGRKRYQNNVRAQLQVVEVSDGRIKINPLANWDEAQVRAAFKEFSLPQHPLFDEGFASIGCAPCTRRILEGEHGRAGRWSGSDKTECGIHRI